MKKALIIFSMIALNAYGQHSSEELLIVDMINSYRVKNNLTELKIDSRLDTVAKLHVENVYENISKRKYKDSNYHSWFPDKLNRWTADVIGKNEKSYMDNKANEIAGYKKLTSENYVHSTYDMTAEKAVKSWIKSVGHRNTMIEKGDYSNIHWKNIGVAIYKGHACVWFGE